MTPSRWSEPADKWDSRVRELDSLHLRDVALLHLSQIAIPALLLAARCGEASCVPVTEVHLYAKALEQECYERAHSSVKENKGLVFSKDFTFLRKYSQLVLRVIGTLHERFPECEEVEASAEVLTPANLQTMKHRVELRRNAKLQIRESKITTCSNRDCKSRKFRMQKIRTRSADEDDTFRYECVMCRTVWHV